MRRRPKQVTLFFESLIGVMVVGLGAVLAWFLSLFLGAMDRGGWTGRHFIALAYNWQTLIAGVLAVGAAFLASLSVAAQITSEIETEAWRRYSRERALRATLPLTLAEMADYAEDCIRQLDNALGMARVVKDPVFRITGQPLPSGVASALSNLIEASADDETAPLVRLLRNVQVQHSRWGGLVQAVSGARFTPPTAHDLAGSIYDAARIHAQCEALMPFARDEGELPGPTTADNVRRAVRLVLVEAPEEVEVVIALHEAAEHAAQPAEGRWDWPRRYRRSGQTRRSVGAQSPPPC
jgi:hypothetical protein